VGFRGSASLDVGLCGFGDEYRVNLSRPQDIPGITT
jgi:hypothetical protein